MTTGAGFDAVGSAPAGLGTPTANAALKSPGYQTSDTGAVSSVLVNGDGDYEYDAYGNEKGMADSAQRVYLLLATAQESRANYRSFGLQRPTHITAQTPRNVDAFVRTALKPAIDDGSVTLTGIEVSSEGTKVLAIIRWTDNRTRESRSTPLPLGQ